MGISKDIWPGWKTVRLLGRGNYGSVYEIQRENFGHIEKAAVKIISIPQSQGEINTYKENNLDESSITARFEDSLTKITNEYYLMSQLKGNSNIVSCDDFRCVQHDNTVGWDVYIKMELLNPLPQSLGTEIPEEQVIKVGKDLCRALSLCRQRHIVHRDIKPSNIFISEDGNYKLGDFGIARCMEGTSTGTMIGTYHYMAPEVYQNEPYGSTADIYSLGLVLYWLLNDRRMPFFPLAPQPYTAQEELDAHRIRMSGRPLPPPVHGSHALKQVVLKACAFKPSARYQSPEDMLGALNSIGANSHQPEYKRSHRWLAVGGLVLAVGVFVVLGFLLHDHHASSTSLSENVTTTVSRETVETLHVHQWEAATCTSPRTCRICGATEGPPLQHQWVDATYDSPMTCARCGATSGDPLQAQVPKHLRRLAAGNYHSVFLTDGGNVIAIGRTTSSDFKKHDTRCDVESWKNIVAVSASSHTLGLKSDGTVVAVGSNGYGQCDVSGWTDIMAIDAGNNHSLGLQKDGTVAAVGSNSHGQCDVEDWQDIIAVAASDETSYGLTEDGRVLSAGKYSYGSGWYDIIAIDASPFHLVGLRSDGTVVQQGSCSVWEEDTTEQWHDITAISAGSTFTLGLCRDGTVVAAGAASYDPDRMDVWNWHDIVEISAGMGHSIGLQADGRIVATGENGYGQCDIRNIS